MEEYSKSNEVIVGAPREPREDLDDVIKLYMPKQRRQRMQRKLVFTFGLKIFRFFLLVTAFFLIYYCLYRLYVQNAVTTPDIPTSVSPAETSEEETTAEYVFELPIIINESNTEINIEEYFENDTFIKLPQGRGIKVIIVNSHSSEMVTENLSVADLSEDLAKILESRGIGVCFENSENDADGMIGAYARMSESVSRLKDIYNEAVVVIDIHNSDSGMPLTYTIGIDDKFAWNENLLFVCNIYRSMKDVESAFRILPSSLGQDNGLLTINIGIGGSQYEDSEVRSWLIAFADGLLRIFNEEPLA